MGFIIKQPLETNQGILTEAYVRIEMYRVDVFNGYLHTTVCMYPSKQGAADSFPEYFGESQTKPSQNVGVNITYNDQEMEYPTYFYFPMTSSVQIEQPVFETTTTTQTSTYYDFDDTGNIVEKTRTEDVVKSVQTGTETIIKYKVDVAQAEGNVYAFAYNLVKAEYGKIFGNENIVDE
jgi:hypothetical protein